ncbi:hypothetical protein [Flagellimonas sp.]|uniref:hypothetical protein n=1 Tax=Flagellimonas sp. TaxID=2058762 RepID=UPI003BAB2FB5
MRVFKVYHTVDDQDNPDYIESNAPFKSDDKKAWAGPGYYFWDSFIEYAHNWGKIHYNGNYVICSGLLQEKAEGDCFDLLGNTEHMLYLEELTKKLKEKNPKEELTFERAIRYAKDNGLFPFKIIRITNVIKIYPNDSAPNVLKLKDSGKRSSFMTIKKRIVIYIESMNDADLKDFNIEYPDKYIKGYLA